MLGDNGIHIKENTIMDKILVVVDMQNDFIDGVLGSPEAQAIVPKVVERIKQYDIVVVTYDTHKKDYLQTEEGRHLPIPHCIFGEWGWKLNTTVFDALNITTGDVFIKTKQTFGYSWSSKDFDYEDFVIKPEEITEIEIIGLDTDFCVLANAFTLKSAFPNVHIKINAECCAGSTPEWHEKALDMLEHCHCEIINRK